MSNAIPGLRPVLRTLPSVAASLTIVFGLATAESLIGGGHITPSTRSHEDSVRIGPAVNPQIDTVRHEEHRPAPGQLACTLGGACFDPEATASSAGRGRGPTNFGMTPPRITHADLSRPNGPSWPGVPDTDPIPVVASVDPHFTPGGEHDGGAAGTPGAGGHGRGAGETQIVALLPGGNSPISGSSEGGGSGGAGGGGNGSEGDSGGRVGSGGGNAGGGGFGGGAGGTNQEKSKSSGHAGEENDDDSPTQLLRLAAAPDEVSAVPEPASAAILVLGLGGLALRRRR